MQINNRGSHYYPVLPTEPRGNNKLPVIYNDVGGIQPIVSEERADNTTVVLPVEETNDSQQSRFVREFITVERDLERSGSQTQSLPRSVQHYLSVAENSRPDRPSGNLIDETV